ncbi:hypothetical protein Tco_0719420 [Tanacetum coccineum]
MVLMPGSIRAEEAGRWPAQRKIYVPECTPHVFEFELRGMDAAEYNILEREMEISSEEKKVLVEARKGIEDLNLNCLRQRGVAARRVPSATSLNVVAGEDVTNSWDEASVVNGLNSNEAFRQEGCTRGYLSRHLSVWNDTGLAETLVSIDDPYLPRLDEPPAEVPSTNVLSTVVIIPHAGPSVSVEDYDNPDSSSGFLRTLSPSSER